MDIENLLIKKGKKISEVKWGKLSKLKRIRTLEGQGIDFKSIFDKVLYYLQEVGLMTYSSENSFTITGEGFDLSPKISWAQDNLRFMREEDAERYRVAFYKNFYCKTFVRQTKETV